MSGLASAWRRAGRWVGRVVLGPSTRRRFSPFAARHAPDGTFFVIAVPRSLGLLEPCLKLVRGHVSLALIVNGLPAAEEEALARLVPEAPRFRLSTVPGSWWEHGAVLDLLSDGVAGAFGLLDHDCFVLDPSVLDGLRPDDGELLAAPDVAGFWGLNEASGLRFPRTHLVMLDAPRVRGVRRRHGISCRKAARTPARLRGPLRALGLGDHNLPSPALGFWDTLQLVMAAGLADGLRWRLQPVPEGSLVHFGGATRKTKAGTIAR
ncbi:MAG: hypothetical protein R2991_05090 [Thermoanaerobaculia bacterium]